MTYGEIEATVKEILAKQLTMEVRKINLESRLVEDLGLILLGLWKWLLNWKKNLT